MIKNYKTYLKILNEETEVVQPVVVTGGTDNVSQTDNFNLDDILSKISTKIKEKYNNLNKKVSNISLKTTFDGKSVMKDDNFVVQNYYIIGKYKDGDKTDNIGDNVWVQIKPLAVKENGFTFEILESELTGTKRAELFDFIRYKNEELDQTLTKGSYMFTTTDKKDEILKALGVEAKAKKEEPKSNVKEIQTLQSEKGEVQNIDRETINGLIKKYETSILNSEVKPEHFYQEGLTLLRKIYRSSLNSTEKIELLGIMNEIFKKNDEKYNNFVKLIYTIESYTKKLKEEKPVQNDKFDDTKKKLNDQYKQEFDKIMKINNDNKNNPKPSNEIYTILSPISKNIFDSNINSGDKIGMLDEIVKFVKSLQGSYGNEKDSTKSFDKLINELEDYKLKSNVKTK